MWDPHLKKDIDFLEKIQGKAVRFIFSKYRQFDSPNELMASNGIPTLSLCTRLHRILYFRNILTGKVNIGIPSYVKPLKTRISRHYHQESTQYTFARTNAMKSSFFPHTIQDWDSLSKEIFDANKFEDALEVYLPH